MDLGRQRGFLLDGEDPPKKVGCRKKSYFLEFMNVGVIIIIIIEDFIFVFMNYLHNLRTQVWASYVTLNHFLCIQTVYTYS